MVSLRGRHLGLGALLLALLVVGCGGGLRSFPQEDQLEIKILDAESHRLSDVQVTYERDELVFYGQVVKKVEDCTKPGHVDVAVVAASGERLVVTSVPYFERGSKNRGWASADFRGRLPVVPAVGSLLILAFHLGECRPDDQFDCPNNLAVEFLDAQ